VWEQLIQLHNKRFKVERIQTIQQQQPTPRSYPYGYLGALQHLPDVRYNFCLLWLSKTHPHSSILYSKFFVCNAPQTILFWRTLTASFLTTVLPILTSDNELSLRTLKRIPLLQFVQFHSWSMSGHLGYLPLTLQQLITLPWVDQCLMSQFWCIIYPHLNNYTPAEKLLQKSTNHILQWRCSHPSVNKVWNTLYSPSMSACDVPCQPLTLKMCLWLHVHPKIPLWQQP
jgi:hypothetical protein